MRRLTVLIILLLGGQAAVGAQTRIVSRLHTVSMHIDSPQTYNALLRFFERDLRWPVMYGKAWTPEREGRRGYAGIWAGNVVLEICGPYAGETFPDGTRARLHGLTFRPDRSVDESILGLDRLSIIHKPPFGSIDSGSRFVVLDDPAMTSPGLAVSIMQVFDRSRETAEQEAARGALTANRGGRLGLISVQEIQVVYRDAASLGKWREFLAPDNRGTGDGPTLRFVEGGAGALGEIVLRVALASQATTLLKSLDSEGILAGVKIRFIE